MLKVLIVDDDPDMLDLLQFNFLASGFTVFTAATAMEALHRALQRLPDVIILDVLLPDLDGITVCEILRKQPSTACIPVVMLTALGGQMARLVALDSGADEYVTKPVRPRDLIERVVNLLRTRRGITPVLEGL